MAVNKVPVLKRCRSLGLEPSYLGYEESLEQIGQGIEQLSGVVQGNAASSEENTAISVNLAEGAAKMHDRVNIFKLF